MIHPASSHAERAAVAQAAWLRLPHGGRDGVRLRVHCARSHHVAAVYETDAGLVYLAPVRPRSHGSGDLPDQPHGDQAPHHWLDLLDPAAQPTADDALPAWCDCGHRALSRSAVLGWLAAGEHRVVVD